MARAALAIGGAAIGFAIGGPFGARLGFVGGLVLGNWLFPPDTPGPGKPPDLKVQLSQLGRPIPRLHATHQWAGNVIWIKNNEIDTFVVSHSVGKGGLSQEQKERKFKASFAVGYAKGPIGGVLRIKADGKLIADYTDDNTQEVKKYDGLKIRIYLGGEDQEIDPLIEATDGEANTPALRGLFYIVFEDLPLEDYGNRIPNVEVEAFSTGTPAVPLATTGTFDSIATSEEDVFRAADGLCYSRGNGDRDLEIYDPLNQETIFNGLYSNPLGIGNLAGGGGEGVRVDGGMIYAKSNANNAGRINFIDGNAYTLVGQLGRAQLSPGRYDLLAGRADVVASQEHSTEISSFTNKLSNFIAVFHAGKTIVINPDVNGVSANGTAGTIVGAATSSEEGDGRNLGWPAIDDSLVVWCLTNNASQVFVHEWFWDRGRDALAEIDAGNDTFPVELSLTDISSSIVDFGGGSEDIKCTWIREQNALLLVLANYAYLFDCASKTIIGDGIEVTDGVSGTNLRSIMRSGVSPDGKIIFKRTADKLSVLDTRAWLLEVDKYDIADWSLSGGINGSTYISELNAFLDVAKPNARLFFLDRFSDDPKSLQLIMEEELALAGAEASEIDMSGLSGETVEGYLIVNRTQLRNAVGPLSETHHFDVVEIDGKLTGVIRGGASQFTIPESDLGAYLLGSQRPTSLMESADAERQLPFRIDLKYVDRNFEYQESTQSDKRIEEVTATREIVTFETTEVFSDVDKPKQVVRTLLAEAWEAQRQYSTQLTSKYLRLDPSDVGVIQKDSENFAVRLIQTDFDNWLLKLRAVYDSRTVYEQSATGESHVVVTPPFVIARDSLLFVMDTALLRDADNSSGLYVGAGPKVDDSGYNGATIQESADDVEYNNVANVLVGVAYGFATTVLADFTRWTVVDGDSSVIVRWVNGDDPVTVTDTEFFNNASIFLIGDEIVCVRDVVDNGDGTFTLSHFLRGRLGTEDQIDQHAIGDRVIRLDADTIRTVSLPIENLDVSRFMRPWTVGAQAPSPSVAYSNSNRRLRPLSPYHVQVVRESNGDLTITWERRTRRRTVWENSLVAPLGEDSEEYAIDFLDIDTESVKRTVTDIASKTYTYLRADQISDGLAGGPEFGSIEPTVPNGDFQTGDLTNWLVEKGLWTVVSDQGSLRLQTNLAGESIIVSDLIDLVSAGLSAGDIDSDLVSLAIDFLERRVTSAHTYKVGARFHGSPEMQDLGVTNGDFETADLTGWTTEAGSWINAADQGSRRLETNSTNTNIIASDAISLTSGGLTGVQIDAGDATAEIFFRARRVTSSHRYKIGIRWLDGASATISEDLSSDIDPSGSSSWLRAPIFSRTIPATARSAQIIIHGIDIGSGWVGFDDFEFRAGVLLSESLSDERSASTSTSWPAADTVRLAIPADCRFMQIVVQGTEVNGGWTGFDNFTLKMGKAGNGELIIDLFQVSSDIKAEDGLGRGIARRATLTE